MMQSLIKRFFIITLLFCSPINQAKEKLKIPLYLPTRSDQINKTVIKLNDELLETGFNFEIIHSDLWQQYQQNIRTGSPGVYFAPPHFTAWLIQQHNFTPLLKVEGKLKYVIMSKKRDQHIFEINDLVDQDICTQNPLNLDFLLIKRAFKKNIQTANPLLVNSVFDEVKNPDTSCSAFSISNHIFEHEERNNPGIYIRLAQSKELNNYAFSIHPSLSKEYLPPLLKFLHRKKVNEILTPLLALTADNTSLTDIKNDDYPVEYIQELEEYWDKK